MSTVSTTINEIVEIGKAERKLIDKAAKLWLRISRWTHATDVEFYDGKTAQEKVGNINGITSDFNIGQDDIAASSFMTKRIKTDLNDGIINDRIQLVIQPDGTLGWKKDGADTVIPFKGEVKQIIKNPNWLWNGGAATLNGVKAGDNVAVFVCGAVSEDKGASFSPTPDVFAINHTGMIGIWHKINSNTISINNLHHLGGNNSKMMYFTF